MNYILRHTADQDQGGSGLNVRAGFNQALIKTKLFVISRPERQGGFGSS